MFKRILSAVLVSAAALFCGAGLTAGAYERENFHRDGDWGYTVLEDGTAAVSGYFGNDKDVAVPEKLGEYTVTSLGGGWYIDENGVTQIYGNIHGIEYAEDGSISDSKVYSPFSSNANIESVTLPETVTSVGAISFKNCTSLKNVSLNEGITVLGNNCFEGCTSLETLDIPESAVFIDQQFCLNCTALKSVDIGGARCEASVFEGCISLGSFTVPASWGNIPASCFDGCSSLTEVEISDGITEIGDGAFRNCVSLKEIALPDSVTAVYNEAFGGCSSLGSVTLGDSLDTLGNLAFDGCALEYISVPDSLVRIGSGAFGTDPDLVLDCSRYSAAASYAEENGIACSWAEADTRTESTETTVLSSESDAGFVLLLIVLVAAAATIVVLIVLIVKNRNVPDDLNEPAEECADTELPAETPSEKNGEQAENIPDEAPAEITEET